MLNKLYNSNSTLFNILLYHKIFKIHYFSSFILYYKYISVSVGSIIVVINQNIDIIKVNPETRIKIGFLKFSNINLLHNLMFEIV